MNLTTNTTSSEVSKLLKILILSLGFFCWIIFLGIITRDAPSCGKGVSICNSLTSDGKYKSILCLGSPRDYMRSILSQKEAAESSSSTTDDSSPMVQYINYAYEISERFYPEVRADYVCAIIYHESRFIPNLINPKSGTQGLTQINPKWHTDRARRLGVIDLYDPYGNILVCFDILSELTRQSDFRYAINFYAGGYPYANAYRETASPFELELSEILNEQNFSQYCFDRNI